VIELQGRVGVDGRAVGIVARAVHRQNAAGSLSAGRLDSSARLVGTSQPGAPRTKKRFVRPSPRVCPMESQPAPCVAWVASGKSAFSSQPVGHSRVETRTIAEGVRLRYRAGASLGAG
jgi:hypothetical protein